MQPLIRHFQPNWTPELEEDLHKALDVVVEETSLNTIQQEIYDFLIEYRKAHGYAPTRKEIGYKIGKPPGSVQFHLGKIEDKGYINLQIGRWRGITIAKRDDMSERERFEKWADTRAYDLEEFEAGGNAGAYLSVQTSVVWAAWQAALESREES